EVVTGGPLGEEPAGGRLGNRAAVVARGEELSAGVEIHRPLDDDGHTVDGREVGRHLRRGQGRIVLVHPDIGARPRPDEVRLLDDPTAPEQIADTYLGGLVCRVLQEVEQVEPAVRGTFGEVPRRARL